MELLAIVFFVVRDEFFANPVLAENSDQREVINFKLLIFRRMITIKSPLLERDISPESVS